MSALTSLPSFHDFNVATRDVKFSSEAGLLNEATKTNYFLSMILEGLDIKKLMKGGKKLVDHIQGGTGQTYGPYDPGAEESPVASDHLIEIAVPWSFNRAYYAYDEEETDLNSGDVDAYIDLKKAYELQCAVDIANGMEEQLFALPDNRTMEDRTTKPYTPYSLLCFNTRDGLVPSSSNGGIASGSANWTNLQTINTTANSWWVNKLANYSAASPDDPDSGLINAFMAATMRTKFEMPTAVKKFSTPEATTLRKHRILTNEEGVRFYTNRMYGLNDRMQNVNDPYISGPQYKGIPVEHVAQLDSAGWTTGQPDFLFYNFNVIRPFFHSKWFMKEKMTDGGSKQPNRHVVWKFIWYNWFIKSRRRQCRITAV